MNTAIIIPAFNEVKSIGKVIDAIPSEFKDLIIVVDNGSNDGTYQEAESKGAKVLFCKKRGYGSACLMGVNYALEKNVSFVMFLDADYSDNPQDLRFLYEKLIKDNLDLVIGSRTCGLAEPGALLPQARFGNWLSTFLIRLLWGYQFTDLGPMRIIKSDALRRIKMEDPNFGWTVEMQVKAAKLKLKTGEIPVHYKKRIGTSKITGTVSGTIKAGIKILYTIFYLYFKNE